MFKKLTYFILIIILAFSMLPTGIVLADDTLVQNVDLLFNGDMEWLGTSLSCWTGTHLPETEIIHGGSQSLKLTSTAALSEAEIENERQLHSQSIDGFIPGQEYTASCWVYTEDLIGGNYRKDAYAGMKVEFLSETSGSIPSEQLYFNFKTNSSYGKWQYLEQTFVCPEGASGTASIQVRHDGVGTVYYDDLKIVGPTTAEIVEKKEQYKKCYELCMHYYTKANNDADAASYLVDASNLIKNPGFESAYENDTLERAENNEYYITKANGTKQKVTGALNWDGCSNYMLQYKDNPEFSDLNITEADYEVIYRDETVSRTDEHSMKIHQPTGYVAPNAPYAMQIVKSGTDKCGEDFVPGVDYLLTAWVKTEDIASITGGAFFKIQTNGTTTESFESSTVRYTDGEWHQIKHLFTMPEGATSLYVYARIRGAGTVWYDDLCLGRADSTPYLDFGTKHTFYYTDEPLIEAWANFRTDAYVIEDGSSTKFTLLDENGTIVRTHSFKPPSANTSWEFESSLLTEKTKYILKAEYILADGTVKDEFTKNIYRFDRPKSMDTEGNIYDTETGEIIPPLFIYGAKSSTLGDLAEAGLTVVRINDMTQGDADMKLKLDDAHEKGLKVLVALYSGYPAGHPSRIETTRSVVSKFHDHPAIAAWMMMDEPSHGLSSLTIRTYDEMLYYLEEGYKAIREIDDVHPVYNIETIGKAHDAYERTSQMCDIFAIDPYPNALEYAIDGYIQKLTQRAVNAVYEERPVWVLGIAADWAGGYGCPINSAMLRYQVYDALWSGAKGAGHYLSDSETYTDPTFTSIYTETFRKSKESGELDEIFDHFSAGNSPTWAEGSGDGYEWQSWRKENGDIYLAVRSKLASTGVIDELTADINLVSSDGNTSIDGFDATLVNGISEETVTSLTSNFYCTLTAGEVSLYKITPKTGYTLSNLETSSNDSSVTIEYDVTTHAIEEGGTVIYAFYDASGRFVKMEKEDANFDASGHITRTFSKLDFEKVKVFIWDALGTLVPYSNMIE